MVKHLLLSAAAEGGLSGAFCDNREHLVIGFSDQVPLWAKDTGRKGIFSASELHSKEHKKDFSEVREAIAQVVNTEKAADFIVGPLREAKKPLRRSSTGSISSSAVRRALSFGSEPSTPGRPAEPEEKPEQQPPAEQPEQPPSQQPVSDQAQQPQPLCDQPKQQPSLTSLCLFPQGTEASNLRSFISLAASPL